MSSTTQPTRIAVTGAAGFLGQAIVKNLGAHWPLRLLDITAAAAPANSESLIGSVANLDDAMKLCEGCSDLVIAHMAPNRPEIYGTPIVPFDVNVKGTANLLHAAAAHKMRRVVLMSSTGVVGGHIARETFLTADLPPAPLKSRYALTKALQEMIVRHFHDDTGAPVSVLRPAYICDEDSLTDKYGKKRNTVNWQFIDPRDIAEGVRLSLLAANLKYDVFYMLGHPKAESRADMRHAREVLGWQPRHTFERYPLDAK
jgi:nucleoside-diphosphate-sugar epimerase